MTIKDKKIVVLIETIQKLSLAQSIDDVTKLVRQAARKLVDSDGSTVVLREEDLCYYIDEEAIGPLWKGKRFPMKSCISGWTMINKDITVIEDIYLDSRIPIDAYKPTFVKSLVMVPIRIEQPMGAIGNYWKIKHIPTSEEIEMLKALANSSSIALENIAKNCELERANTSLRETLAARDEFLSIASHELKTPLTPLKLQLQIAENQLLEGTNDVSFLLKNSVKKVDALLNLIENLLDVSRIQLERMNLDLVQFDFVDAVESAVEQMLPQLQDSHCELQLNITRHLIGSWDRLRIEQIITNLLSNCCKYATGTPVQISLTGTNRDSVLFSVKDKGKGIPREAHDKIFNRFERSGPDVKVSSGFGLGLYIVKKIVEAHKGTIHLESAINNGANFVIELPIRGDLFLSD